MRIRALCVGPGLGLKQRTPCDTASFRLVPSMCPGQLAAPTPAPITSLFSAGMWLVAGNLCASEIRALLCTCSGARGSEGLAVTKTLPCSQATSDIITAAKLDSEKDEALEYVASAELRLHPLYGDVTFDDLCHFKCCSFRKLGCMPRLGAVLTEREYSPVRSDHAARQAERHSKRKVGVFLPLAKQPGLRLVSRLTVFKAVTSRYECDGVYNGKSAALPQLRGAIAERMRRAHFFIERDARADAVPLLLDVLALKPVHAGASYLLGLLHLRGGGVSQRRGARYRAVRRRWEAGTFGSSI